MRSPRVEGLRDDTVLCCNKFIACVIASSRGPFARVHIPG